MKKYVSFRQRKKMRDFLGYAGSVSYKHLDVYKRQDVTKELRKSEFEGLEQQFNQYIMENEKESICRL